jgi:hypothetical protein
LSVLFHCHLFFIQIFLHICHCFLTLKWNKCHTFVLTNLTFICPCIASISLEYNQQAATFSRSINFYKASSCFRRFLRPSSGAQHCTYSVRYCQTSTAACCCHGWDSGRQQYWFDNTRRCMHSAALLMMGGGTAWNM